MLIYVVILLSNVKNIDVYHKYQVCVLFKIWKWQHIGKREIAFCTEIEFFDPLSIPNVQRTFLSTISTFESTPKQISNSWSVWVVG